MNKENSQHGALGLGSELERLTAKGASRRGVLRAMAAAGMMSVTGAGLLTASGAALAQAKPKQGGKIRVATQSASAADTLDPAPSINGGWRSHAVAGIGRRNGSFVTVLDLDRLLAAPLPVAA